MTKQRRSRPWCARPGHRPGRSEPARCGLFRTFCGDHQRFVAWAKTGSDDQRAIRADVRLNEIAGETLRLRLCANKDGDAEDNTAEAQKQCAFAMRQKAQRNIKRRGHGAFGGGGELISRCRTVSPGRNLSWSETITWLPSSKPLVTSVKSRVRNPTPTVRECTMPSFTSSA